MLQEFFRGIFEDVVAGVWKLQRVCFGEAGLESGEEFVGCEAPVLHPPDELYGVVLELSESLFDAAEGSVAGMGLVKWNILNELSDGDAISPGVIGGEVAGFGGG